MMKLGFYYHIPAHCEGGEIFVPGYLGRFLDCLAGHCQELVLFLHVPNNGENANFDYVIQSKNISIHLLEERGSFINRMIHPMRYSREIEAMQNQLDGMLIRGPSPLLPHISRRIEKVPTILLLVGDYLLGVDSLPQPFWRKELIRLWSWWNFLGEVRAAKKSLVFVNSRALARQFKGHAKQIAETRTTTLTKDDFYLRDDTCKIKPVRLLYTGRMDPAKGLLDIVEALSILVDRGYDVTLDLVGWPEEGTGIIDNIMTHSLESNIGDRIHYHGYKPVGPELFEFYKNADIYIIASQTSEGFPRTIWEAMAHGLPVVATRVGSIPDFIEGMAELVEPKNSQAIADGVEKIITDGAIRKEYIKLGSRLAHQYTLDIQVEEMAKVISDWLD